jgi:hypothetical protein
VRDSALPSVRTVTGEACSRLKVRELRLRVEAGAGDELLKESEDVRDEDRKDAAKDLQDVAQESARTPVAVARLRKLVKKLGPDFAEGARKIIVDVAAETVKKTLGMG